MSDAVSVWKRAESLKAAPQFTNYSKVIIHVDDKSQITVGDDSGRVFEIDNPFGTQEIAQRILERLRGYQYQPYEASEALLDPAAEIGDGVTVNTVYGGIYKSSLSFSALMKADIAAPYEEEIDKEFSFSSPIERKFKRELGDVRATLLVQANEIRAEVAQKVDSEGGTQSFGWKLLSDRWAVTSNGQEIFTVDANGGTFTGKVVASSGKIGGFDITDTTISNYKNGRGVWISTEPWSDGTVFQVGSGFKVSSDGSLTANNGTFNGKVQAKNIQYGNGNTMPGGAITGGSIGTGQLTSYCSGGIGGGVAFNNAVKGSLVGMLKANKLEVVNEFRAYGTSIYGWKHTTVTTPTGAVTLHYLGY